MDIKLKSNNKQKNNRAKMGDAAYKIGVCHKTEDTWPHNQSDKNLTNDCRLIDTGCQEIPGQGHEKKQTHLKLNR